MNGSDGAHPHRDEHGRFQRGCRPGPGRPAGSSDPVTRAFYEILAHFLRGDRKGRQRGMAALDRLYDKSPVRYVSLMAKVLVEVAAPCERRSRTRAQVEALRQMVCEGGLDGR